MNILVVAQYFPPDLGGAATRAYNLAKGLALNGCTVTVVAAAPHYPHGNIPKKYRWTPLKVEQMDNFKVIRTYMPPIKSEGFFKRLILIGSFTISALFAMPFVGKVDAIWSSSYVPGYIYKRIERKPLALNVDDLTLEDLVDLELLPKDSLTLRIGEWVYRLLYVKADIVTPISPGYIAVLADKYCVKREKIHVIRGGVDLSVFKPSIPKPGSKKFVVLYSGAFSVAYDFNQIIKAAKIIEAKDKDIEFVIQGTGELLSSMLELTNKLNVKNVHIIDEILTRPAVAELLSSADVLILPLAPFYKSGRPYRGMSSKLYEYQAVEKPIISCSKGIPSEYVEITKSGITIDPDDYQGLANAVLTLRQHPEVAQTMAENGRKYVENQASIKAVGQKMLDIVQMISNYQIER